MERSDSERRDRTKIELALMRLRAIYGELHDTRAGVGVLHLEAAMAAFESRLRSSNHGAPS